MDRSHGIYHIHKYIIMHNYRYRSNTMCAILCAYSMHIHLNPGTHGANSTPDILFGKSPNPRWQQVPQPALGRDFQRHSQRSCFTYSASLNSINVYISLSRPSMYDTTTSTTTTTTTTTTTHPQPTGPGTCTWKWHPMASRQNNNDSTISCSPKHCHYFCNSKDPRLGRFDLRLWNISSHSGLFWWVLRST